MRSCVYVAALDDSGRPSRPSSNTATVCHALRLDGRCVVDKFNLYLAEAGFETDLYIDGAEGGESNNSEKKLSE